MKTNWNSRTIFMDVREVSVGGGQCRAQAKPEGHVRSLPGMGTILAAMVVPEIDGIVRFPSAQKLCGYSGLCLSTSSGGGKNFQANCYHIATNGLAGPSSRPAEVSCQFRTNL
jgi:Transposase IS116/IS110/IS902 family